MSAPTPSVAPVNCCGRKDGAGCVCAAEAKCSCGKKSALHCDCERAPVENKIEGETCSCGQRPANACTCSRSGNENSSNAAEEIDFTSKK